MTKKEWMRRRYEKFKPAYDALIKCYPFGLDDLPGEEWLPIPNWEGYHESNYGRTKSFHKGKQLIVKPHLSRNGYLQMSLHKDGKQKTFRVHRLVALYFIPNPENKPEVNHKDGHPLNNHVSNLEWATGSENQRHAVDIGLIAQGEDNYQAELTNEQVQFIRNNPDGLNGRQLADLFGVDVMTISNIQRGKTYKTAGGSVRKVKSRPIRISGKIRDQIKAEYKAGVRGFGCKSLAKKYGVDPKTIIDIVREG